MCSTAHNKFHIKNELNNLKTIIWSTPPRKYEDYRSQTMTERRKWEWGHRILMAMGMGSRLPHEPVLGHGRHGYI